MSERWNKKTGCADSDLVAFVVVVAAAAAAAAAPYYVSL